MVPGFHPGYGRVRETCRSELCSRSGWRLVGWRGDFGVVGDGAFIRQLCAVEGLGKLSRLKPLPQDSELIAPTGAAANP